MSRTAEDAIRDSLATMRAEVPGAEGGSVPLRLRADTLRFVKKRGSPIRQLSYVTCDGEGGPNGQTRWHWTVLAHQEEPGRWSAQGVAGGSGDSPVLGKAWANLGGNWGPGGFSAGGTVEDSGQGVVRVCLTGAEGRTFDDTVDDGVVLFMSEEPVAMPMQVELVLVEPTLRDGLAPEGWEERPLADGSRHLVYKRYFQPQGVGRRAEWGRGHFDGELFLIVVSSAQVA